MDVNRIPESQRRELAHWAYRGTRQMLKDPEIRKEFEAWKESRKKDMTRIRPRDDVRRET